MRAAISSYGTIRELKVLDKFDHRRLRYVVIQYCSNDVSENQEFLSHGGALPIQGRDACGAAAHEWNDHWKPWLSAFLLRELVKIVAPPAANTNPPSTADPTEREASEFVHVLARGTKWDGIKLIVMQIGANRDNNPESAAAVRRHLGADGVPASLQWATVLDPSWFLTANDYYTFDYEHTNARGHRAVASRLITAMASD